MDLQILATSDTHGKFDPWDYAANKEDASGSVAQQATAIREARTDVYKRQHTHGPAQ